MSTLDLKLPPQLVDFTPDPKFSKGPILKSIKDLEQGEVKKETVIATSGAEVIMANYELLQHDFPCLKLENLEKLHPELKVVKGKAKKLIIRDLIDEWLIRHTCYVSENQTKQEYVNTKIPTTGEKVEAFRPVLYGRALVFSLLNNYKGLNIDAEEMGYEDGLIDVKGTGLEEGKEHHFYDHGNGLLTLAEAFREYIYQQLVEAAFRHSGSNFETLPTYAIIKLDFDVKNTGGIAGPAGLLVRRAQRRPENPGGLPAFKTDMQLLHIEVELLLRRYGITSCNYVTEVRLWKDKGKLKLTYGGKHVNSLNEEQLKNIEEVSRIKEDRLIFEGVNIQHTREFGRDPWRAVVIDFGSFCVKEKFKNPILSLVTDKLMRWGGSIWPDFESYTQPIPELAVPYELWGNETEFWGFKANLYNSKLSIVCDGVASYLREGRLMREDAVNIIHAFLHTATSRWEKK
ncbi:MAG: hypothetical protein P1U56_08785 [Saprospiraceae bacterium]|nr:hypothetical protein [Saprospiraceae bacterium]